MFYIGITDWWFCLLRLCEFTRIERSIILIVYVYRFIVLAYWGFCVRNPNTENSYYTKTHIILGNDKGWVYIVVGTSTFDHNRLASWSGPWYVGTQFMANLNNLTAWGFVTSQHNYKSVWNKKCTHRCIPHRTLTSDRRVPAQKRPVVCKACRCNYVIMQNGAHILMVCKYCPIKYPRRSVIVRCVTFMSFVSHPIRHV